MVTQVTVEARDKCYIVAGCLLQLIKKRGRFDIIINLCPAFNYGKSSKDMVLRSYSLNLLRVI